MREGIRVEFCNEEAKPSPIAYIGKPVINCVSSIEAAFYIILVYRVAFLFYSCLSRFLHANNGLLMFGRFRNRNRSRQSSY